MGREITVKRRNILSGILGLCVAAVMVVHFLDTPLIRQSVSSSEKVESSSQLSVTSVDEESIVQDTTFTTSSPSSTGSGTSSFSVSPMSIVSDSSFSTKNEKEKEK